MWSSICNEKKKKRESLKTFPIRIRLSNANGRAPQGNGGELVTADRKF